MRGATLTAANREGGFDMSESWMQIISAAVLGWIGWELRQLRRDINSRVHYHECDRRMVEHSRRIERLEHFME